MEMDTTIKREITFARFVKLAEWFDGEHGDKFLYTVEGIDLPSRNEQWAELTDYHPSKNGVTVLVTVDPNAAFTIRHAEFDELLSLMGFGEFTPITVNKRPSLFDAHGKF